MERENAIYATGKRKRSVARTWLTPGNGEIVVNNKALDAYFTVPTACVTVKEPLVLTDTVGNYDITVNVHGGGFSGQAGAIRRGITRALIIADPDLRAELKKAGFVRRDSRIKERKKYGQKGARARFQFSKR